MEYSIGGEVLQGEAGERGSEGTLKRGSEESHMWRLFLRPLCKAVEGYRSSGLEPLNSPPGGFIHGAAGGGFCCKSNGRMGRSRGYKPLLRFLTGFLPSKNLSTIDHEVEDNRRSARCNCSNDPPKSNETPNS